MRIENTNEIDALFQQACANYEEKIRYFREACLLNYYQENGNPFEKILGEFKESLKTSGISLIFKMDELYAKLLSEKNREKINSEIQELSELMSAVMQCFAATKNAQVIEAFDEVKIKCVKLLDNKTHAEKVPLGAASTLRDKVKAAAILFVGVLALGALAFGISTLIFASSGTALAVGGAAATAISIGVVQSSTLALAVSASIAAAGAFFLGFCTSQLKMCYHAFFGKSGVLGQAENFHSLLNNKVKQALKPAEQNAQPSLSKHQPPKNT